MEAYKNWFKTCSWPQIHLGALEHVRNQFHSVLLRYLIVNTGSGPGVFPAQRQYSEYFALCDTIRTGRKAAQPMNMSLFTL